MELSQYLQYAAALFVVLAMIGILAWIAKRMRRGSGSGAGGKLGMGRHLGVLEAAAVDGQRRLVLVRRDHVGHLLLIGGGQDVLVETDIPLGVAGEQPRAHVAPYAEPVAAEPELAGEPLGHDEIYQEPPQPPPQQPARPRVPVRGQPPAAAPAPQQTQQPPPAQQPAQQPAPVMQPAPMREAQQQPSLANIRPGGEIRSTEQK